MKKEHRTHNITYTQAGGSCFVGQESGKFMVFLLLRCRLWRRKGTLVAAIRGTRTKDIVRVLKKIPEEIRKIIKEVSMEMAKKSINI